MKLILTSSKRCMEGIVFTAGRRFTSGNSEWRRGEDSFSFVCYYFVNFLTTNFSESSHSISLSLRIGKRIAAIAIAILLHHLASPSDEMGTLSLDSEYLSLEFSIRSIISTFLTHVN